MALDLNSVVTRIVEQGGNVEASAFTAEEIQALGSNPDVSLYGANYEAVRAGMEKLGIDGAQISAQDGLYRQWGTSALTGWRSFYYDSNLGFSSKEKSAVMHSMSLHGQDQQVMGALISLADSNQDNAWITSAAYEGISNQLASGVDTSQAAGILDNVSEDLGNSRLGVEDLEGLKMLIDLSTRGDIKSREVLARAFKNSDLMDYFSTDGGDEARSAVLGLLASLNEAPYNPVLDELQDHAEYLIESWGGKSEEEVVCIPEALCNILNESPSDRVNALRAFANIGGDFPPMAILDYLPQVAEYAKEGYGVEVRVATFKALEHYSGFISKGTVSGRGFTTQMSKEDLASIDWALYQGLRAKSPDVRLAAASAIQTIYNQETVESWSPPATASE